MRGLYRVAACTARLGCYALCMERTDAVKNAIATFCRLNGIDPESDGVRELTTAIISEVSGAAAGAKGNARRYSDRHAE